MRATRLRAVTTVVAMGLVAGACSQQSDFSVGESIEAPDDVAASTTSIVRRDVTTTTAAPTTSQVAPDPAPTTGADPVSALAAIARGVALDPSLVAALSGADLNGIASLLALDPASLGGLGLDPAQIASFAGSVAASPPPVQDQLALPAPDPAVLLGLLAGSVDPGSIANGSAALVAQALASAIDAVALQVSPELTINLGEVLEEIDPNAFSQFSANQDNAALLALFTSAILEANPLLTQQLLANEALDPVLREILVQLQGLSNTLGDVALAALIDAVSRLFPGLVPRR